MSRRYFRKKDPTGKRENTEWIEMNGSEYYRFITAPESRGRYFIDMGDVVLECTKAEYKMYKAEDAHSNYILEQEAGWITQSLESLSREDGLCGEEFIADPTEDVSNSAIQNIQKEALRKALQMLSKEEYRMIMLKYHPVYQLSEKKIGILVGLSQSGVSRRLTAIKNFLKKSVIEFEKSSQ